MRNRIIIFMLMLLQGAAASAQDAVLKFQEELAARSNEINTIVCDFVQVRSMAVLDRDDVKNGRFTYLRPENILLAFDDGDYIMLTDKKFSMKSAGNVTEMKISSNQMLKELKRILSACMTGDVKAMAAGFTIEVEEQPDMYHLTFVPLKGKGAAKMKAIEMVFDRRDMSLSMLKMTEPSGDSMRYDFRNKKFNLPVPEGTF